MQSYIHYRTDSTYLIQLAAIFFLLSVCGVWNFLGTTHLVHAAPLPHPLIITLPHSFLQCLCIIIHYPLSFCRFALATHNDPTLRTFLLLPHLSCHL